MMRSQHSIIRIMTMIFLASTTFAILFVGITDDMKFTYAEDGPGRSLIDQNSAQGFNNTLKDEDGCGTNALAIWCV